MLHFLLDRERHRKKVILHYYYYYYYYYYFYYYYYYCCCIYNRRLVVELKTGRSFSICCEIQFSKRPSFAILLLNHFF